MSDFIFQITPGDVIYDIETYPNCFLFYAIHAETKKEWCFEYSFQKNEVEKLALFISKLRQNGCRLVGFNNFNFDYPVIHYLLLNKGIVSVKSVYDKAMSIINSYDNKFQHIIWKDHLVPQVDLFKIHHFDNMARSTSLKVLEFNMKSNSVEGLPFEVGTHLTEEQINILKRYNRYDVEQTLKFYELSLDKIRFREELSKKYNKDFINHNDTKIGKEYFIMELEKAQPGSCYRQTENGREIRQSIRQHIDLKETILPYIQFDNPEFNRILTFFKNKRINETKGVFTELSCQVNDFTFDFGTGGIHGSLSNTVEYSDDDNIIEDWDVASYYPNLAIQNKFYPEHLGEKFCEIYRDVYEQRKKYAKGTSENAMLKLALNGVYGDSNNQYSPFYDSKYTMSITINGQLLLCMLAEALFHSPDVKLLQINTDGLTIKYPRRLQNWVHAVMRWWENLTKLTLENAEYKRMFIRDVNNYLAEYVDGSVKRKGAYEYEMDWHQNHSALIVAKAAEKYLLDGFPLEYIKNPKHDIHDFMLRTKIPKKFKLRWGDEIIQNVTRYYISTNGKPLTKIMPPAGPEGTYKRKNGLLESYYQEILNQTNGEWDERIHTKNKSKYETRETSIHTGWNVQVCNNLEEDFECDINYDYYIKETEKLVSIFQ